MQGTREILQTALKKITPTNKEKAAQKKLAEKIISDIMKSEGKHIDVVLCGSIARDTHLRGDNDLDIFVLFPEKLSRAEFEKEGLRIGKKVFRGKKWEKAFSEHPYIRGVINGFDVEIVPSYKVSSAELLQSAVDRSPFHNKYLLGKMSTSDRKEARLLKQFLKGIKAYGADIKASSVPGYVVELLILRYGSFTKTLKAIAEWKQGQVIDLERRLDEKVSKKKFKDAPLIIVDPVDKNRNVAAALSLNQFSRIIAAARSFNRKPELKFFFGKKQKPWAIGKLRKMLQKKELIAVRLGYPKGALSDIVWGQIQRFAKKTAKHIEMNEFRVLRSKAWTDEKNAIVLVFEVESRMLQKSTRKAGPFVTDEKNSEAFLAKHPLLVAGPRIENGRWVIEVLRKFTRVENVLKAFLKKEKRVEKNYLKKAINKGSRVLEEENLVKLFKQNREFAEFFTTYLKGEEEFL